MNYFGLWSCREDVEGDFGGEGYGGPSDNLPRDAVVLYAGYSTESYEGNCYVLYLQDGKLWEVEGGHCSCYGLDFSPVETSLKTLRQRDMSLVYDWFQGYRNSKDPKETFDRLLDLIEGFMDAGLTMKELEERLDFTMDLGKGYRA